MPRHSVSFLMIFGADDGWFIAQTLCKSIDCNSLCSVSPPTPVYLRKGSRLELHYDVTVSGLRTYGRLLGERL